MAEIKKRQKKDGKYSYTVSIRIKGCKNISQTFDRLTDAKNWSSKIESDLRRGIKVNGIEAKKHTFEEMIERYVNDVLPVRKSDVNKYKTYLNWWKSQIGYKLLSSVSSSVIAECRDKLKLEPSGKAKEKYRSNSTVNRYLACLSIVYSYALNEWEWVDNNPLSKVKKLPENRGRIRYLSDKERENLLSVCRKYENESLIYLLVILALATGARQGELLNLTWDNVYLDSKIPKVCFLNTKNGENKGVPIVGIAYDLLCKYYKNNKKKSNLVFAREDGLKPKDLKWYWEKVRSEAGLIDFRFHDLRHTTATYLAINGASLLQIAEVLGHKTLSMVKRYSHLTMGSTASVLQKMVDEKLS